MNRPCQKLFADAALSRDQHRLRRSRDCLRIPKQPHHRLIPRDDLPKRFRVLQLPRKQTFLSESTSRRSSRNSTARSKPRHQPARLLRLHGIIKRPGLHAPHRRLHLVRPRHDQHGNLRVLRTIKASNSSPESPGIVRSSDTAVTSSCRSKSITFVLSSQHSVFVMPPHATSCETCATRPAHHPPTEPERWGSAAPSFLYILIARRKLTVTVVPFPGADSNASVPPCSPTIRDETDNPSPVAPRSRLVVKNGSVT